MTHRFILGLPVILLSLGVTAVAHAEAPSAVIEAQAHFRRGLDLYEEGNLDAAIAELERAYDLAPNFKVLFNLAQVEDETHDYPAALKAFERYLSDGGDAVPGNRRTEVQAEIEKLRARVAKIAVVVDAPGATIAVDDTVVGESPLTDPVTVGAGHRKVVVTKSGYETVTRALELAGGDSVTVDVRLEMPAPTESVGVNAIPAKRPATAPPTEAKVGTPWIGWIATGALAIGAIVTGSVALHTSSELAADRARFPVTRSELDSTQSRVKTYALVSDVLTAGAVIAGGISLYFSFSGFESSPGSRKTSTRHEPLETVEIRGTF